LARLDAPLAHQATTMPVETEFDPRESTRAANSPTAFSDAESRNGFFTIEIASYSSYYTIALGRIDGSISRSMTEAAA
jgi:hypothetical protein